MKKDKDNQNQAAEQSSPLSGLNFLPLKEGTRKRIPEPLSFGTTDELSRLGPGDRYYPQEVVVYPNPRQVATEVLIEIKRDVQMEVTITSSNKYVWSKLEAYWFDLEERYYARTIRMG